MKFEYPMCRVSLCCLVSLGVVGIQIFESQLWGYMEVDVVITQLLGILLRAAHDVHQDICSNLAGPYGL